MIYKIAVCDDCEADRVYIASLADKWASQKGHTAAVKFFISAEDFLFQYEDEKDYNILLLDIEMGGQNGVELAKKVRQDNEAVQIVFVTGFPDFMAEGYEVAALHYLMKPVLEDKLFQVLDKAAANLAQPIKRLAVTYDRQTELVPVDEIQYVEAQKQYVCIHAEGGVYRMKASLSEMEAQLGRLFYKCQRSFLVNLAHVARIKNSCVVLKSGEEIPISRGMTEKIGKAIIELF